MHILNLIKQQNNQYAINSIFYSDTNMCIITIFSALAT